MLAEGGWEPFDDPGWWFEPKLDGMRAIVTMATDATRIATRTGRDVTERYPELHLVHELVNQVNAVLDGELVCVDERGRPSFELLQQRMHLTNEREIARAAKAQPAALVVFDLLWLDGREVTPLVLEQRRELLETIVEPDHRLQVIARVEGAGRAFVAQARELGLEGVVAKRLGSRYLPGRRSPDWRKIRLTNTQDCVILGFTPGRGGRAGAFGALLVGAYDEGRLRWVGQVGTGFTETALERLLEAVRPLVRPTPAVPELAAAKGATFVEPRLVCEVEYLELTSAGKMRAPSFRGLREDKAPEDCVLERPRRSR
jgi:bifunctional non-homologous end joining protein LigD